MSRKMSGISHLSYFFMGVFLLFYQGSLLGVESFGYISYMTTNIGDDIQAIAAKRFLPKNSYHIDRELIAAFESNSLVHTIVNGWYMHTKNLGWYRPDIEAPLNSWPPASCIDPLLISIYFYPPFESIAFSKSGIEYLKKHAPIGARDYSTLERLEAFGVPSYFSGCLTLTLENSYKGKRDDVIYAVDIPKECLDYLLQHANCPVVELTHGITRELFHENNHKKRLNYVNGILNKYMRAKCVVTARLHAAMPCLALETPVLLIGESTNERMHGLRELTRNCTIDEFIQGKAQFDFNDPPENPKDYLAIREQLKSTVSSWVKQKKLASMRNTGYK